MEKEPIKLEETYYATDGSVYKVDIFGDLYVKNELGSWTPVPPTNNIT